MYLGSVVENMIYLFLLFLFPFILGKFFGNIVYKYRFVLTILSLPFLLLCRYDKNLEEFNKVYEKNTSIALTLASVFVLFQSLLFYFILIRSTSHKTLVGPNARKLRSDQPKVSNTSK